MAKTPIRRALPALFAVAFALAAGCARPSAPTSFYTLSPSAEEGAVFQPPPSVALVGVGPVRLPEALDRPQIVIRSGANQLEVSEFHRWTGGLREEVPGVIAENLTRLLDGMPVVVMPFVGMTFPSHRVVVDIRRFDGAPGATVVLIANWSLADGAEGGQREIRRSRIEEPAGPSMADYVAAQSRALGALSRDIAQALVQAP